MLSWTYCDHRDQFSAPKRVWLNYGRMFQKIPCIVDNVERSVDPNVPWEKIEGSAIDFLPHSQKVTVSLTICPETLYEIPGSADIATADFALSPSAADKYGQYGNKSIIAECRDDLRIKVQTKAEAEMDQMFAAMMDKTNGIQTAMNQPQSLEFASMNEIEAPPMDIQTQFTA